MADTRGLFVSVLVKLVVGYTKGILTGRDFLSKIVTFPGQYTVINEYFRCGIFLNLF